MVSDNKKFTKFLTRHESQYNEMMKEFVKLFNQCNVETQSGTVQFILVGAIVKGFVESSNFSKEEKIKLLEALIADYGRELGKT